MLISLILIVYYQAEEDDGGEERPTTTARNCTCGISDLRDDPGPQHDNEPDIKKEPGGNYRDNDDNSRGSEEPSCTNNKRVFSSSGI